MAGSHDAQTPLSALLPEVHSVLFPYFLIQDFFAR